MSDSKPRRRFRVSLRALLIPVVLLSVPMGWFALKMQEAERQRRAVVAIQKAGGRVFYDYQLNEELNLVVGAEPPAPPWLRELLGDDFFSDVVGVDFSNARETSGVYLVKGLTGLRKLVLQGKRVTDGELATLNGLTELERLKLFATGVTSDGMEHLTGLTKLKRLEIHHAPVTDAGLRHLKGLTNLRHLKLVGIRGTDAGLDNLKELKWLERLELCYWIVTRKGVEELRDALPRCEIVCNQGSLASTLESLSPTSTSQTPSPTQRWRWSRFSLRTLLILVVLSGLPMALFALKMRQARRQRQAVEVIEETGGRVAYDNELYGQEGGLRVPAWLVTLVGEDFFGSVEVVHLEGSQVADAGLEKLTRLTRLQRLVLSHMLVTDVGREHLKGLRRLKRLEFDDTHITEVGIEGSCLFCETGAA